MINEPDPKLTDREKEVLADFLDHMLNGGYSLIYTSKCDPTGLPTLTELMAHYFGRDIVEGPAEVRARVKSQLLKGHPRLSIGEHGE